MGRRTGSRTSSLDIRVVAVALLNSGVPATRISAAFHLDPSTVRRWAARYRRDGMEGLRNRPPTGRIARVDDASLRRLLRSTLTETTIGRRDRSTLREMTRRASASLAASYDFDHLARRLRRILRSEDRNLPASQRLISHPPEPGSMTGRTASPGERRRLDEAIRAKDLGKVHTLLEEDLGILATRNSDGLSPLMVAIYSAADDVAVYLASKQPPDIFEAAAMGDSDRAAWLLSQEPRLVYEFSPDGWTPLHLAAHFGRTNLASMLISKGARVDAVAKNGIANQPLQAAIAGRRPELVRLLIAAGADVDHQSHGGFTAAHIAAENDDVGVLEQLKVAGADLQIKTVGGKTPSDVAVEGGHEAARSWLETDVRTM
jgi:uncharacterized protein